MDNDAFKDLINKNSSVSNNQNNSTRAFARKAVEDEFRKKKRKRGGEGDSSSDEDVNYQASQNRGSKTQHQQNRRLVENDNEKNVRNDLSTRYRDRAKERREGKSAISTDAFSSLSIVPHNKKGLDLALLKMERYELQTKKDGAVSVAFSTDSESIFKKKIITFDQATETLQDFLNHDSGDYAMNLSTGLSNYLHEIVSLKTFDVSTWEGKISTGAVSSTPLQNTKFSMTIDGNPSDQPRSWEIPQQYTLSRNSVSSSTLLPAVLRKKIASFFVYQSGIREKMMEVQQSRTGKQRTSMNSNTEREDDEDSDDDIFGGFDD